MVSKARGLMNIWLLRQNGTKETGKSPVDKTAMAWEQLFIERIVEYPIIKEIPNGLKMDAIAERR